ncbi:SRPBCC family protein [Streptomyces sp. JJ36]|uniref:SRPBCC family protein n=1 Tax=Streptomyces sp. JJ36 TaxID=2736645 RepID=UPI001F1DD5BE|nr:SRPBCC family protein [Streptomyces sp. JJ36]MCF6523616.1 SRPBCC family protein [Streptomyces sp. JJ36]
MRDTLTRVQDEVRHSPAADRLKEELQAYLEARARHAVSGLGQKLGASLARLGEPGDVGSGGPAGGLARGGEAPAAGGSPAKAVLAAGKEAVKEKVKGVVGGGRGRSGGGKSKRVVVVEDIDVGVPVREAYDQWTQYQEFSTFAKGVVSVERSDDTGSDWKVKVAKSTRSLRANVTEQIPDERISWTTEGAKGSVKGVVTFHPLGENLTRVLLVLEYFPGGFLEKTGNLWRAQGRRARLDLKLYRTFLMMRGEATDGWRGEIRDGEVVRDHETAVEDEERAGAGPYEDAEPAEGYEEEPAGPADARRDPEEDGEPRGDALEDGEPEGDGLEEEELDEDQPDEDALDEEEPDEDEAGADEREPARTGG